MIGGGGREKTIGALLLLALRQRSIQCLNIIGGCIWQVNGFITIFALYGKAPFSDLTLKKIKELKKVYDLDLDSGHSHKLVENKP